MKMAPLTLSPALLVATAMLGPRTLSEIEADEKALVRAEAVPGGPGPRKALEG